MRFFTKKNIVSLTPSLFIVVGTFGGIGKYGFMDDYYILESSISGNFDFQIYMTQGRPFSAIYSFFIFSFVDSIDGLIFLHILGSLTLALFGWLLFIYFRDLIQNNLVLITITVIPILVTPGLLLVSAWAVMSSVGVSLVSSILAAFLVRKGTKLTFLLTFFLLIVSFLSYPPSTSIFMCLPCLAWIFSLTSLSKSVDQNELLNNVKRSAINIASAGVASLILLKLISSQYTQNSNRTELVGDVPTKIDYLLNSALPTAVDYFEPNWGFSFYGWLSTALILSLFLLCHPRKSIFNLFWVLPLAICSTFAPVALTAENWPSNRALFASQWVFSTLTIFSILLIIKNLKHLSQNLELLKISSLILLGLSIFHSNNLLITTMKTPQLKELALARGAIELIDPMARIEVKKSEWSDSLAPWVVGDEFGIPSTCQPWVPVPLTKLILNEINPKNKAEVVLVEKVDSTNSLDFSKILNP